MLEYLFSLIVDDKIVDQVALDDHDPDHALEIFLDEFGWSKKLTPLQKENVHVEYKGSRTE